MIRKVLCLLRNGKKMQNVACGFRSDVFPHKQEPDGRLRPSPSTLIIVINLLLAASQHPLLSHISSSLSPFFLTSNTSSIHQALHPSIIKLALHPSFCGSSEQPAWMSSFCSLSSFLYLPFLSLFLIFPVCVFVCVSSGYKIRTAIST